MVTSLLSPLGEGRGTILYGVISMKMTEAQMDHIWKNNLYGTLNSDHKKQFDVWMWGEEFMESEDKGSLQTYTEED